MKNHITTKYIVFYSLSMLLLLCSSILHAQDSEVVNIEEQEKTEVKGLIEQFTSETIYLGNNEQKDKREVTSAVSAVSGEELVKTNSMNPANSLYGLLPGLTVLQNGGSASFRDPGMFIRGVNTLNNNSVLVLIDGIEGDIANLSTLSIESVQVLKDAGALAIYGQRGANGVLLVTTKRGLNQKMDVNINLEMGGHQATSLPNFLDAPAYAQAVNEARTYDGLAPLYSTDDIAMYSNGSSPTFYPNVDWQNESLRDMGSQLNLNASFRGGDDKVKYFAELDYRAEDGLYKEFDLEDFSTQLNYDRINFRTNLDVAVTNTTTLRAYVSGGIDETNIPGSSTGSIMNAISNTPANAFPVKNYNGNWGGTSIYGDNPVAMISSTGYNRYQGVDVMLRGTIEQDLSLWLEGLSGELTVGHNTHSTSNDGQTKKYMYEDLQYQEAVDDMPADTISQVFGENTALDPYSNYGKVFRYSSFSGKLKYKKQSGDHSVDAFLMYVQDKYVGKGHYTTYLRQNIAGNVHYGYKNKYFGDLTLSYAGASVLTAGDRFSLYPAISGAWVMSEEDFMSDAGAIKYFKWRASFGYAGSDRITQNSEDTNYGGIGQYYFTSNNSGSGSYGEGRLGGNPKTERAMMTNLGFDANFFEKLNVSVDAFYNKRTNILVSSGGRVSDVMGATAPLQPIGEVANKGFEASLTWQDQIGDFKYSIGGQYSFARNEILEMGEKPQAYDYLRKTGHSIDQAFGLVSNGFFSSYDDIANSNPQLFSTLSPGDVKYVDQNGDNVINEFDEVAMQYSTKAPEMYYSFNLSAEYKQFGVSALFQGIANQTLYLNTPSVYWPLINNNNISEFSDARWTESTAATATLPRLTTLDNDNNYRKNDIWLVSGNYLKLRNVEVYYLLPESVLSKLKLDNLKVFVRGTNLFSIDNVDQMDPEAKGIGYPTLKTFNAGINFTF